MLGTYAVCVLLLVFHRASAQVATAEKSTSDYYTAAVVEFSPTYKRNDGASTLRENTDAYVRHIETASQQNADIIVFPEDGLTSLYIPEWSRVDPWTTLVPSADDGYVPCTDSGIDVSETLKRLSCAARQNRIYVVVNLAEKRACGEREACPNGMIYHNTNVAFDRTGKVVARYRKVNLYMEPLFNKTDVPEVVTFDTDFGVTFGTFTCFDILFSVPPLQLTRHKGVSNVVFTTAWFSEVPFLTAIQAHFGWAYGENVNLLAAGYHSPRLGNAGSGIYLGRDGIANATMTRDPEHRLLVSRVPKTRTPARTGEEPEEPRKPANPEENAASRKFSPDWIHLMRDNVSTFRSVPLDASMTETVCHESFCCDFDVRLDAANVDGHRQPHHHHHRDHLRRSAAINYRAVVFNGVRLYGTEVEAGVRLCGVIQCSDDSLESCGSVAESGLTFATLNVTATFDDFSEILVMPSVLDTSLIPFRGWSYVERPNGPRTSVTLSLDQPRDLVTFGIYSRDFARDKWNRAI